jgi:hypothetical protein
MILVKSLSKQYIKIVAESIEEIQKVGIQINDHDVVYLQMDKNKGFLSTEGNLEIFTFSNDKFCDFKRTHASK